MMRTRMTIGDVAAHTGTSRRAIRLYEEQGLLAPRRRTPSGYRLFEDADIQLIRFIRNARVLGLSLGEIQEILTISGAGQVPCHRVKEMIGQRIDRIDSAIAGLKALRSVLVEAQRRPGPAGTRTQASEHPCPIINHSATA